jgi:hypothetical protein
LHVVHDHAPVHDGVATRAVAIVPGGPDDGPVGLVHPDVSDLIESAEDEVGHDGRLIPPVHPDGVVSGGAAKIAAPHPPVVIQVGAGIHENRSAADGKPEAQGIRMSVSSQGRQPQRRAIADEQGLVRRVPDGNPSAIGKMVRLRATFGYRPPQTPPRGVRARAQETIGLHVIRGTVRQPVGLVEENRARIQQGKMVQVRFVQQREHTAIVAVADEREIAAGIGDAR